MSESHTVTATYKAKASTGSAIEVQAAGLPIEVNRMIVHAMTKPDEVLDARRQAIQECIDRLINGGKPAEAWMLRSHFGLSYPETENEGSEP